MLKKLNNSSLFFIAIFSLVLVGCGTTPPPLKPKTKVVSIIAAPEEASSYLAQASEAATDINRTKYLLLAAEASVNTRNFHAASDILASLGQVSLMSDTLQAKHVYVSSLLVEQNQGHQQALKQLSFSSDWSLPDWQWAQYYQYRSQLHAAAKQPLQQAEQLTLMGNYVTRALTHDINDTIWDTLQLIDEETLRQHMGRNDNPIFAGWLQLAFIAKHYAVDPNMLVNYLSQWQQQNPTHPSTIKLPTSLARALSAKPYRPNEIAVLLPLTGARGKASHAIKQGIVSSYMANENKAFRLNFIDTTPGIDAAFSKAQTADFIIGPLLQNEVEAIQQIDIAEADVVPQLFLNQSSELATPYIDRFYFSLSPTQEAADAAHKLYQDGIETPLIFASNNATSSRMAQAFDKAWFALTGEHAEIHHYAADQMKQTVQQALGVSDSLERIKRIKTLISSKVVADFRSRRDIDAIYMVTGKQDLLLLKPFIDVNFSVFAESVPLYASSRSRLDRLTKQTAQELNQVTISDIPWLLHSSPESQQVDNLWPTWSNSQKRLFIMGYDALDLVDKLAQMRAFPGYQYHGRSGVLSVTTTGIINRHLSWAKYSRGKLRKQ